MGDWTSALSWWVSSAFCLTAGFTLNVLQAFFPPQWVIAVSNPMTTVGACLFLVGVRHVVGRPIALLRIAPVVFASVLGSALFVFIWPSLQGRVITQLACLSVMTWLNVAALRQLDHGYYHFPARLLLSVNVLLMMFMAARAVSVIVLIPPSAAVSSSPVNALV